MYIVKQFVVKEKNGLKSGERVGWGNILVGGWCI